MRRARLSWGRLLAAVPVLLVSSAARAESAAAGEGWDARHMRSNLARYLDREVPPTAVLGADRYSEIRSGAVEAPPTQVEETVLQISPHGWQPGGPRQSSGGSTGLRPGSSRSSSRSDARADRSSSVRGGAFSAETRHRRSSRSHR